MIEFRCLSISNVSGVVKRKPKKKQAVYSYVEARTTAAPASSPLE